MVLDEWHRSTHKIIEQCERWVAKEPSRRPWYVGGHQIIKDLFFVSATPVNPVLEEEEAIDSEPYDEELFRERIAIAIKRALTIIQGFMGRREEIDGQFFEIAARIKLRKLAAGRFHWKLPRGANQTVAGPTNDELRLVHSGINDDQWSLEYARAVGLVRTIWDPHKQMHRLSRAQAGRRKSFGMPYKIIHVVSNGKRRRPAWCYLSEHPRLARLLKVLECEGVVAPTKEGLVLTRKSKGLVFCAHRGVALGLVETLNKRLGDDTAKTNVDAEDVDSVTDDFNRRATPPYILVATDVLSEGVDLQWACKLLVHYELPWSPLRLFQRVGRLTRRKGRLGFNSNVRVAHVIVPGSVEEERVNRLLRRIHFLADEKLWPTSAPPAKLARSLIGSGPSLHLVEALR